MSRSEFEFRGYRSEHEIQFKLNGARADRYYIIVEGILDRQFYSKHFREGVLSDPDNYRFMDGNTASGEKPVYDVGKAAVLRAYNLVKKNKVANVTLDNSVFIVDRDYYCGEDDLDGNLFSKMEISQEMMRGINMTPVHSIESFFLIKENLQIVFTTLEREDFERFFEQLLVFAKITVDYFFMISLAYVIGSQTGDIYQRSYNEMDEFGFSMAANRTIKYNEKLIGYEKDNLRHYLLEHDINKTKLSRMKNHFSDAPENVQGHMGMHFLTTYLRNTYPEIGPDIANCESRVRGLAKKIKVNMTIVNGAGTIVGTD
jgi:hypothetical protein